jgi:hypothetical protein
MRIDFNQSGSWRKGPDFDERDMEIVTSAAEKLADLTDSKLRIIGESGEVCSYRDVSCGWRANKTRGAA